jgi:hypothetical protein
MLLAQDSLTGLTVRTFELLHLQSTGLQGCFQCVKQTEPFHINEEHPSQLFVLTARQGRQVPSTSQLNDLTQATTDIGLCSVREFGTVSVPPKTKKTRMKVYKIQYKVVCHPMFLPYITPNCISEDQLTLKWKSGRHVSLNITIYITEPIFFSSVFLMK